QYLYQEGDDYIFMNNETYEQIPIPGHQITGLPYMKEGMTLEVVTDASTETVLFADMPVKVVLAITYTEPGLKGDTATNTTKPATLETGAEIRVPLFINEGELVEVDTRNGDYVGRVKA
ncbi:MAG: elongation factor P, partial [Bacteroidaceae bacterium]|nr:elongation factor P [Bacteroidaceae bacterium]